MSHVNTKGPVNGLIERYMPLARRMANDLARRVPGTDADEAQCEANLALVEAAHGFDPAEYPGVDFSVYARIHINGKLMDYLDANRFGQFGVPRRLKRAAGELRRGMEALSSRGAEVSIESLAHETGLARKTVAEALMLPTSRAAGIVPDREPDDDDSRSDDVWDALDHCDHREREVMARRFGLDGNGERSRGDVAEEMGLDVQSVRRAEESARRKLEGRLRLALA